MMKNKNTAYEMAQAILKARWPAGTPGSKGGQFAPKGVTGGSSKWGDMWSGQTSLFGGLHKPSNTYVQPKAPPPGAKPHPKLDEKGKQIIIDYPSKATPSQNLHNSNAVVTFPAHRPDVVPAELHGVKFKSWIAPTTPEGWNNSIGINRKLVEPPFVIPEPAHPNGFKKRAGTGVVVVESDGRVWVTEPSNHFGGYMHTFPKGGVEKGLSLQANALKEAYEETGLKVRIVGHLADVERDTSYARYYVAQRIGGTPADAGWETQAVKMVPQSKIGTYLNRSVDKQIADALLVYNHLNVRKAAKDPTDKGASGHWAKQERWPAGSPLGGQWKAMDIDGIPLPPKIAGGADGKNPAYHKAASAMYLAAKDGYMNTVIAGTNKYEPKFAKFVTGEAKNSHDKWGAQVHQYGLALQSIYGNIKPKAEASATAISGNMKLSDMKHVGAKPGGSSSGAIYQDASGQQWLVKGYGNEHQARAEVLASKLYNAAGVDTPDMKLIDLGSKHGGGVGVASKMIDEALHPANASGFKSAVQENFGAHAWVANWDCIGLDHANTMFGASSHKQYMVDPGGSLMYRATGASKGGAWNKDVKELSTLRDPSVNPHAAAFFKDMPLDKMNQSFEKVTNVEDSTIKKLVQTYMPNETGLADTLIARKAVIAGELAKAKKLEPLLDNAPPHDKIASVATAPTNSGHDSKLAASIRSKVGAPKTASQLTIYDIATDATKSYDQRLAELGDHAKHLSLDHNKKYASAVVMELHAAKLAQEASAPKPAAPKSSASKYGVAEPQNSVHHHLLSVADKADMTDHQKAVFFADMASPNGGFNDPANASYAAKLHQHFAGKTTAQQSAEWTDVVHPPRTPKQQNMAMVADDTAWAVETKANYFKLQMEEATKPSDKAYATALHQYFSAKMGAQSSASSAPPPPPAPPPAPEKPKGPLPNFDSYKTDSAANAKSHNAKIDKIAAMAQAGDVSGLLAQSFGSNTYAAKQVKATNAALQALGTSEFVSLGYKGTAAGAPKPVTQQPVPAQDAKPYFRIPEKPDFSNWNGAGKGLSSKAPINQQNDELATKIHKLASQGKIDELKALKFEVLTPEGAKTGQTAGIEAHKSKHVVAYWKDAIKGATTPYVPPKKLTAEELSQVNAKISQIASAHADVAKLVHATKKIGRYAVLGNVSGVDLSGWPPQELSQKNGKVDVQDLYKTSKARFDALSSVKKQAIRDYTGSGYHSMNDATTGEGTHSKTGYAISGIDEASMKLPVGTILSRKISDPPPGLVEQLTAAGEGTVLKDFGIISTSVRPGAWGGPIHLRITVADNVKGLFVAHDPSGNGNPISVNPGEGEVILPYGTRFYIKKVHKKGESITDAHGKWGGGSGTTVIELVALPNMK